MQTSSALCNAPVVSLQAPACDGSNFTQRDEILEVNQMKKLIFQSGVLLLLLTLMSTGHAQNERYIPVFCNQGHSIQDAVDRATEGATVDIWGTCNEAVVIRTDRIRVSAISGQVTFINPPGESVAFTVRADNVEISNLNITGGTSSVLITKGSSATITNNHIFDSTEMAISIGSGSYGEISGNDLSSTIIGCPFNSQIFLAGNAAADILNITINASSGNGIVAVANSSAVANGNVVSVAGFSGIFIGANSSMAFFASNTVNNSGGSTIVCDAGGDLGVFAMQNVTPGSVFVDPGCELDNVAGDVNFFPPAVNGTFETGDLTGWTASGINGGFAVVSQEGTCFSSNNTVGLTFNGDFAANVRSSGPAPTNSIGILTSDLFVAGSGISFRALSENDDGRPAADPVTLEVRVLDGAGSVLLSQIVTTNIVTLSTVCPGGDLRDGIFSTHIVDTSAFDGQDIRVEFRQHTNVAGSGFFTLIDDVAVNP